MKYKKKNDFGKVFQFPTYYTPDPKVFLECGKAYNKSDYFPEIYNLFPYNIRQLGTNRFPAMTSQSTPAPYQAYPSSHYNIQSGWNCFGWLAFNPTTKMYQDYEHVRYFWLAADSDTTPWLEFNMGNEFYLDSYTMLLPPNNVSYCSFTWPYIMSWTLLALDSNNKEYTIDIQNDVSFSNNQTRTFVIDQFEQSPFYKFRWTFSKTNNTYRGGHTFAVHYITLNTVTVEDYVKYTTMWEIPKYPAPNGYKSYICINPDKYWI
jgi:hypothetical protein